MRFICLKIRDMPGDVGRCQEMPEDAGRCREMSEDAMRCQKMPGDDRILALYVENVIKIGFRSDTDGQSPSHSSKDARIRAHRENKKELYQSFEKKKKERKIMFRW